MAKYDEHKTSQSLIINFIPLASFEFGGMKNNDEFGKLISLAPLVV